MRRGSPGVTAGRLVHWNIADLGGDEKLLSLILGRNQRFQSRNNALGIRTCVVLAPSSKGRLPNPMGAQL
jgi:hypothetical protein